MRIRCLLGLHKWVCVMKRVPDYDRMGGIADCEYVACDRCGAKLPLIEKVEQAQEKFREGRQLANVKRYGSNLPPPCPKPPPPANPPRKR